jgi:hypothetical protein
MQVALAILNVHFTSTRWCRKTNTIYRLLEHSGLATNLAKKNTRQCWRGVIFHRQGSNDVKGNFHPNNYYLQYSHCKLKK